MAGFARPFSFVHRGLRGQLGTRHCEPRVSANALPDDKLREAIQPDFTK
ncbi:hypothetical protein [Afipia felis]